MSIEQKPKPRKKVETDEEREARWMKIQEKALKDPKHVILNEGQDDVEKTKEWQRGVMDGNTTDNAGN